MNNGFEIQFETLVYTGDVQTVSVKVTRDLGAPGDTRYVTFNGETKALEFDGTSATVEFSVSAAGDYAWSLGTAGGPANDGSGIYTLSVSTVDTDTSWANAEAVITDLDGKELKAEADGTYDLAYTGEAQYILIESITPEGAETLTSDDFDIAYTPSDVREIVDAGTYTAVATVTKKGSAYYGKQLTVTFDIVDELSEAVAFIDADGDGVLDEGEDEIVYNGQARGASISFAVDGKKIETESRNFYFANGQSATGKVKDAGSYKAVIEGESGSAFDGQKATVEFDIEVLDINTAEVVINDLEDDNAKYSNIKAATKIDGIALAELGSEVELSADIVDGKVGSYSATVSAAEDSTNVTGTKTVSFNVVGEVVSSGLKYFTKSVSEDETLEFDSTAEDKNYRQFDADAIHVDNVDDEDIVVTITDAKGNVVTAPAADGTVYNVTVAIVTDDYSQGGKFSFKVKQINGSLENAVATVTYNGDVVSSISHDYDGTDAMESVKVAVKSGKETLEEGVDYELVLTKAGKEVENATDAGNYVLTIKGLAFEGSIAVPVTVNRAIIEAIAVQGYAGANTEIAYTGETVTPTILYTLDGDAEEIEWRVLPADQYFLDNFTKDGKSIKASEVVEAADYTADITATSKMVNYDFDAAVANTISFEIVESVAFADVDANAWYAESVYTAASADFRYMNGIEGTKLFMPEAQITRAEVAQVFANMADQDTTDFEGLFPTKFSDVDSTAWYAPAVSWASKAGIVGGYEGTDTFGTFDNATREQIATMIYRYAKAQGMDVTVEDEAAALAKYSDGASVSEYAKTAMAYCVEQGIFGVGVDSLRPADNMSRAEMAATSVRVQPDGRVEAIA